MLHCIFQLILICFNMKMPKLQIILQFVFIKYSCDEWLFGNKKVISIIGSNKNQ